MDQESIKSGSNVPKPDPLIIPSIFSCRGLNIHEIPFQNGLINNFSDGVSNQRAPSFFILAEDDI